MIIEEINRYVYVSVDNETLDITLRVVEEIKEINYGG